MVVTVVIQLVVQLVVQLLVVTVQQVQLKTVQVTATAVQNLGSVTVLKIVKTKHLVVT